MTLAETHADRALLEQILLETSLPPHNDSAGGLACPATAALSLHSFVFTATRRRRLHFQHVRTCLLIKISTACHFFLLSSSDMSAPAAAPGSAEPEHGFAKDFSAVDAAPSKHGGAGAGQQAAAVGEAVVARLRDLKLAASEQLGSLGDKVLTNWNPGRVLEETIDVPVGILGWQLRFPSGWGPYLCLPLQEGRYTRLQLAGALPLPCVYTRAGAMHARAYWRCMSMRTCTSMRFERWLHTDVSPVARHPFTP